MQDEESKRDVRIPRTSPRHHPSSNLMQTDFLVTARDIDLRPNTVLSISNPSSSNQCVNKTFKPDSLESVFRTNSKATGHLGIHLKCESSPKQVNPIFAQENSYEGQKTLSRDCEDLPEYQNLTNSRVNESE